MYYPHADDEIVAMGYANYSQIEENEVMVTVKEEAFRTYMIDNYFAKLDRETLLDLLESAIDLESMVNMSSELFGLPFEFSMDGQVSLTDVSELLLMHSEEPVIDDDLPCMACSDDDEDNDIVTNYDWDDEEFAPYDELDDSVEDKKREV